MNLKDELIDYEPQSGRMRRPPVHIQLEITSRCNLRCVHCPKDFGKDENHPALDMAPATLARVAPWLASARFVNLNGIGEPLVYPQFSELLRHAAAGGAELAFNTNGLLLTGARCDELVARRVHAVSVSLDGHDANLPIRGVPYETIRDRIVALDASKRRAGSSLPHLSISWTLMRRNSLELPRVLRDLLPRVHLHSVQVQPLVVYYETTRGENAYRDPMAEDALHDAIAIARAHAVPLHLFRANAALDERHRQAELSGQLGQFSSTYGCIDPFFQVMVRSDGSVLACSNGLAPQLDVGAHELEAIWNHEFYRTLRQRLHAQRFEGRCRTCSFVHGSADNQEEPLRHGVEHSQAARFFRGGYRRRQPPTVPELPPFLGSAR